MMKPIGWIGQKSGVFRTYQVGENDTPVFSAEQLQKYARALQRIALNVSGDLPAQVIADETLSSPTKPNE